MKLDNLLMSLAGPDVKPLFRIQELKRSLPSPQIVSAKPRMTYRPSRANPNHPLINMDTLEVVERIKLEVHPIMRMLMVHIHTNKV
jgi:hypothetical protein